MAELQMRFLGDIDLAVDGAPLDAIKSKKALALLAYLAVTGTVHERLALATLLWADTPEANARMNLRKVVSALKNTFGSYLLITNETLAFNKNSSCWIDVEKLSSAGSQLRGGGSASSPSLEALQDASDLYRGDFMAGFYVRNAPLFEEWILAQQARLRETWLDILNALAEGYADTGRTSEAVETLRRLLSMEPWREEAQRELMTLLAEAGRRSEALAQYELCREALALEFGAEPSPSTTDLFEAIRDKRYEPLVNVKTKSKQDRVEERGPPPPSPYRGLFAFREEDAAFFFGREQATRQLVGEVKSQTMSAIVGSSGSGKSSLVSAGLVANLRGDQGRSFARFRPGVRPYDSLAATLVDLLEPGLSETEKIVEAGRMAAALRGGELALSSVIDRINQKSDPESWTLIVIDQFEELYTLCPDEGLRDRFLGALTGTAADQNLRSRPTACICLTLRADFMDAALANRQFADTLQGSTFVLGPMTREELAEAIVKPAEFQGVDFEAGLVERILDDIGGSSGSLPLLQFALDKLWQEQSGWLLTHEAYQSVGGAKGALALHAEEILQNLDEEQKEAARRVLVQMVRPGTKSEDTGRVATRQEIGDRDWPTVQRLADARLLVTGRDAVGKETAELTHEALISVWRRLQSWLEEDRAFRRWQDRIRSAMSIWQVSDRDEGALLRGRPLAEAEGWLQEQGDSIGAEEYSYIRESQDLRDRRELEKREAILARERGRRLIIAGLSLLLVIAVGALIFAVAQSQRASEQARIAFARELASASANSLETDPELAIHLALEAVETTYSEGENILVEAEEALHRAVQASRIDYSLPQGNAAAFSPDGEQLAAGGSDGSISVWDGVSGAHIRDFEGHSAPITSLDFSPNGSLLASASSDHERIIWDVKDGKPLLKLPGDEAAPLAQSLSAVRFSPDGKYLLSTAQFAEAGIWDVTSGREIVHFEESAGPTAAFSPDGSSVALMTAVWDIADVLGRVDQEADDAQGEPESLTWSDRQFDYVEPFIEFIAPSSEIESAFREPGSVSYSPDGGRLLTTVTSSQAVMRSAENGEPQFVLSGHASIINGTAFSPAGDMAATASADGTARIWDTETGENLLVLEGHQGEVVQAAFSPYGQRLATSSLDGTTKVWDLSVGIHGERPSPARHNGSVNVKFHPRLPLLATLGQDGLAYIVDAPTGKVTTLTEVGLNIASVSEAGPLIVFTADPSFRPDGVMVALTDRDGAVFLINTQSGESQRIVQLNEVVSVMTFSPGGELLFIGGEQGDLFMLDVETGEVVAEWVVQDGFVNSLAFSADGEELVIAGADGDILVVSVDQFLEVGSLENGSGSTNTIPDEALINYTEAHGDVITNLEFNSEGNKYLTSSWDGTTRIWEANTGDLLRTLAGHRGRVWHAAFSPDGKRIATAGADGSLILWDTESGDQLFTLDSNPEGYVSLDFSADGTYLAAAGTDGSLGIYVMPADELIALARSRLTRELTEEECRRYLHRESCQG